MFSPPTILTFLLASTAVSALPRLLTPQPIAATAALNDFLSETADLEIRSATNATSALPNASVKLCTEPNFGGDCVEVEWVVNQCIDLRG